MTMRTLLDALCREILDEKSGGILADCRFENAAGALVPPKIYRQNLPVIEYFADADEYLRLIAPSVMVFIAEVQTRAPREDDGGRLAHDVAEVYLEFTAYGADPEKSGALDILHMAESVKRRFRADPMLAPCFLCHDEIFFMADPTDTAPLFKGGLQLRFDIPAEARVSKFT
jgi:hypothetical protein